MLPRAARLKRNRDFRAVYSRRRSFATSNLALYIRRRHVDEPGAERGSRIGFVISKKIAKRAHDRNRLKRRLREICRLNFLGRLSERNIVVDALFVARSPAPTVDFARLAADVDTLGRQAGLL